MISMLSVRPEAVGIIKMFGVLSILGTILALAVALHVRARIKNIAFEIHTLKRGPTALRFCLLD